MTFTTFRVVGGNRGGAFHHGEAEYKIVPYEMAKETPKYYYEPDGSLHNKRTTSNSAWFANVDDALATIIDKINEAIESIHRTLSNVLNVIVPKHSFTRILYVCKFRDEIFSLKEYTVLEYKNRGKNKGWRVENEKTRVRNIKRDAGFVPQVTTSGRCYVYQHQSNAHNPEKPIERWVGQDWNTMKLLVEQYANDRIRYLERQKQHHREWVRLFILEVAEKQRGLDNVTKDSGSRNAERLVAGGEGTGSLSSDNLPQANYGG